MKTTTQRTHEHEQARCTSHGSTSNAQAKNRPCKAHYAPVECSVPILNNLVFRFCGAWLWLLSSVMESRVKGHSQGKCAHLLRQHGRGTPWPRGINRRRYHPIWCQFWCQLIWRVAAEYDSSRQSRPAQKGVKHCRLAGATTRTLR